MRDEQAIWLPSQHFSGRLGYKPKWLILHGSGGGSSARNVATWFQNPKSMVSAHYIIDQSGEIIQCVLESNCAWSNGVKSEGYDDFWSTVSNPNFETISIEYQKPDEANETPLTESQKNASFELIKRICRRWNIPMKEADALGGITGHFSIHPKGRSRCPGAFLWSDLWNFLKREGVMSIDLTTPGVSNYFEGDQNRWRCKLTQKSIVYAILEFYKTFGGTELCGITHLGMPISDEIYPRQNVALQAFERAIVAYDPQRQLDNPPGTAGNKCYLVHIDQGYGLQIISGPVVSSLQAQAQRLYEEKSMLQTQLAQLQKSQREPLAMLQVLHQINQLTSQFEGSQQS